MNTTIPSGLFVLAALTAMLGCQPGAEPPEAEETGIASSWSEDGARYLRENAKKPGVVSLDSGLQYKILTEGDGRTPGASDSVTVHYRGTLINDKEFDSSYKRGEPATFPVNRVIAGWTEALQLMQEGDKWQLTIPSGLGYGSRGAGSDIPADSVLIFDVELLKVE